MMPSQPIPQVRRVLRRPQFRFGLLVLVPLFTYYVVFDAGPIIAAVAVSVLDYNILHPELSTFAGLGNFNDVFSDRDFFTALRNSATYAVVYGVTMVPVSLLVASMLSSVRQGRQVYLFAIFLPVVMSLVAVSVLFMWFYDVQSGPFDIFLRFVGLRPLEFIHNQDQVLYSIAGMEIWKNLGFYTVIMLAGMLNIPDSYYDAAKVDGANALQRFFFVTIPLLGHTLLLVCVILAINGFQVFTPMMVMTSGGPGHASYVLNMLIYQQGIGQMRLGYGTAAAFVLFAIVFVVTILQLRLIRPRWEY